MLIKKIILFAIIPFLLPLISFSQNTTYSPDGKKKERNTANVTGARKILVIPFEPKLYMSEIDEHVNKETKMNFNQIRNTFRSGLDVSVVAAFRKKNKVFSLMSDTGNAVTDQNYIYESIGYKYDLLPDDNNKGQKDNSSGKPKIQNGQLTVTTNDQKKFMDVQITNPHLLSTLNKKYGAEIFVFISELDLKVEAESNEKYSSGNYGRIANVHYSIYDLKGKLLTAGMATKNFPASVNDPKKIVNSYFRDIAQIILNNYILAIAPQPPGN
jgi:hypothetical protein